MPITQTPPARHADPAPLASPATTRRAALGQVALLWQSKAPAMQQMLSRIDRIASSDVTVLAVGESGTGKEGVARAVHDRSVRRDGPFVAVNCGAIPPTLIESELFGHEKGGFTGAVQQKAGYFEQALGGTLFLDEVTEMPPDMQVKLLRVLETQTFNRVGGDTPIVCDARIIAATNRDPLEAVRAGQFREDLLYRLAVFPLHIPPLRERREDIIPLARHFLGAFNQMEDASKVFCAASLDRLQAYDWPGNIRELKHAVYRAFILADHMVDVPNPNIANQPPRPATEDGIVQIRIGTTLADSQREIILATLDSFDGDKRRAALALGISLKTLYNRLDVYKAG